MVGTRNIDWWESVSVIRTHGEDGEVIDWPIICAQFDTEAISLIRPDLNITPEEAVAITDNVLEALQEMYDECIEEWLSEVR